MANNNHNLNPNKHFMQNIFDEQALYPTIKDSLIASDVMYWATKYQSNEIEKVEILETWLSSPLPITNEEAVVIINILKRCLILFGIKMTEAERETFFGVIHDMTEALGC